MADTAPAISAAPGQQAAPRNGAFGTKAPLRDRLAGIALATPATALMLALLIGPTLAVGVLSLTDWGFGARSFAFIGLDNYAEMAGDPVFRRSLINTLVYVGVVMPVSVALALAVALLIQGGRFGRTFFRTAYFLPVASTLTIAFAASTPVVYYNADLVAQAGGDPDAFPDNWDDLIALGAQIDALGDEIDGIYYHFWGSDWMWQAAVGSFGGELMDEAEEVVLFDDERGHRAAALLARFRDEAGMPAYDRSAAQQSFQAGRLGIKLDSSAFLARMEDGVGDRFDLRVASFPVADRENGWLPTGGAGIVMITDDEARQEAAWRYMTFAAGPEGAAIVVRNSGYAPTNQRAADDPQFLGDFYAENPNHQATRDQVAFLGPWFAYPGERGVRVTDTIMSTLRDVLDTDADPAQTLDALADTVRAELAR